MGYVEQMNYLFLYKIVKVQSAEDQEEMLKIEVKYANALFFFFHYFYSSSGEG